MSSDTEDIDSLKEEYYETLEEHPSLQSLLNSDGGLLLARVGSYAPWPARFSEPGEFAKMIKHRTKKGQLCVYFFGSRNYGWVSRNAIQPFATDLPGLKSTKKQHIQLLQSALAEAKLVTDMSDELSIRFFDRVMERRSEPMDMPCALCNRVDDHYSLLILCDGKDCHKEYHMNCLQPPLTSVPEGNWYCPECEKDPSRKRGRNKPRNREDSPSSASAKPTQPASEASPSSAVASPLLAPAQAHPLEEPSADDSAPSMPRKRGRKPKDLSLKRKLPSTPSEEQATTPQNGSQKKTRAQSSPVQAPLQAPPILAVPTPRAPSPSQAISTPTNSVPPIAQPELSPAPDGVISEEKCMVCSYGGELIVCEFPGCTKVYHQFCLGAFPFPKDEDAIWFCPRHTCAVSGQRESPPTIANPATSKAHHKQLLWKCTQCPLALSGQVMPNLPVNQLAQKKHKTFVCPYCFYSAPALVQFAKLLERIWSTIATNRQGMPFCGPLLAGIDPSASENSGDLFKILAKIRRLDYMESLEFEEDVSGVVEQALAIIGDRSEPIAEAAKTLNIMCKEQFSIHHTKLMFLDARIRRLKKDGKLQEEVEELAQRWPIPWRRECGPFDGTYYTTIEARSLEEWTAYITEASLYVSCDEEESHEPERPASREAEMYDSESGWRNQQRVAGPYGSATPPRPGGSMPPFALTAPSGLTLSEGTDVMVALTELAHSNGIGRRPLAGRIESELDSIDGRDMFLSPSLSEMEHMFDQQSAVLRRALEAHGALYKAWMISKQQMLGLGDRTFSVGEGRVAAELRLANKNLRARLDNKDKLIEQLTTDQLSLRSQVKQMQQNMQELKQRSVELESELKKTKEAAATSTNAPAPSSSSGNERALNANEGRRPSPRGRGYRRKG